MVDNVARAVLEQVVATSTGSNLTLSAEQTVDGVSAIASDRILVRNQTNGAENGVWVVADGAWIRADDFTGQQYTGTQVYVTGGTANADTFYYLATTGDPVIGLVATTWTLSPPDAHADDLTIHFTEASIDHLNIQNIGTRTHAQLDTLWDRHQSLTTISTDTTLTSTHRYVKCDATSASANPLLPSTTAGTTGDDYILTATDVTNGVTVTPSGSQTIGVLASTSWQLQKGETLHLYNDGSNWQVQ